jgi:GR25 family glycosyltransferase involved in LPS biosynthesis
MTQSILPDTSIYLINLRERNDRYLESLLEFKKIGLKESDFTRIEAKKTLNGAEGCALSHAFTLANFLFTTQCEFCLILEDDFEIKNPASFTSDIKILLNKGMLWDVLLLASNASVAIKKTVYENVYRVVHAQTTSAYIVRRDFAPSLIKKFYESAGHIRETTAILPHQDQRFLFAPDILWKELQLNYHFLAYLPQITKQRKSFSDVENKITDYNV